MNKTIKAVRNVLVLLSITSIFFSFPVSQTASAFTQQQNIADFLPSLANSHSVLKVVSQTQAETWQKSVGQKVQWSVSPSLSNLSNSNFTSSTRLHAAVYLTSTTSSSGTKDISIGGTYNMTGYIAISPDSLAWVPLGTYRVKIVLFDYSSSISAVSAAPITLVQGTLPFLYVTVPTDNASWKQNSVQKIGWITNFKKGTATTGLLQYRGLTITKPYGTNTTHPVSSDNIIHVINSANNTMMLVNLSMGMVPGVEQTIFAPIAILDDLGIFGHKKNPDGTIAGIYAIAYNPTDNTYGQQYRLRKTNEFRDFKEALIEATNATARINVPPGTYKIGVGAIVNGTVEVFATSTATITVTGASTTTALITPESTPTVSTANVSQATGNWFSNLLHSIFR